MARPSTMFPSERPGKSCGASWSDPLRVTGEIPRVGFGSQYDVTLEAVASADDLRANQGMLSWRGSHETRVRGQLESTIDQVSTDAEKFRWRLGEENYRAVRNLLALALAELTYVDLVHERWLEGRWGLERPTYAPECDPRSGSVGPGEVFGGGFDRCPTVEELQLRSDAREYIVERFVDACHFIRCAQYGLWRVWLYRSALDEWKSTPRGGGPDGFAPTPPKPPKPPTAAGGFANRPPPPPPPPVEPPTPTPPPFPADLGEGDGLPDPGEPELPDEDDVPAPPAPLPDGSQGPGEPSAPLPDGSQGPGATPVPRPDGDVRPGEPPFPQPGGEPADNPWSSPERPGPSQYPDVVAADAIEAGQDTVTTVVATAAAAKVATAMVVVGGVVGVTWLVTRNRKGSGA